MRKQKIADVDRQPRSFARIYTAYIGVDRKLHSARDGEVIEDPEYRWADEYLVCVAPRQLQCGALHHAGVLAYQDAQSGRVLDELRSMGKLDNTLVI